MSQIELITGLPNWRWKDHSADEIATMNVDELIDESDFIWRISDVAVAGFTHTSYTSPPWMWFVLAEHVGIKDLIDFARLKVRIPQGTLTAVESAFSVGLKFAKFYGFVETGEIVEGYGRLYKIMRKI